MVKFNQDIAQFLSDAYEGRDATQRRIASLEPLNLKGGETVIDLGCGAGHLALEAARAVGKTGKVIAIDPSQSMREKTSTRCHDRQNIDVLDATAEDTGLGENSADGIVAIQVFSYLDDTLRALLEARRVLKASGKLVICDIHWGGAIWASSDSELGNKVIQFWQQQLKCSSAPEKLNALSKNVGFSDVRVIPVPVIDIDCRPDGLAQMLMTLIKQSAMQQESSLLPDIERWLDDQQNRLSKNQFFFSVTNFVTVIQ